MNQLRVVAILTLAILISAPAAVWPGTESTLNVTTDRDHLGVGESVQIEVRLWSVMEGRVLPPLGGVLTVSVIDAARGVAVRTFRAEPDGSAKRFRVSWSPALAGGYRIVAGYENVFSGERVEAEALVTVGLGPGPGGTTTSAATTLPAPAPTAPPAAAVPAETVPAPATTAPAALSGTRTRVVLRLEEREQGDEKIIRIRVTTDSGAPVKRGEVLVSADKGTLSRGGGREALVALNSRGRAALGWTPGPEGQGRVTVDFLGGWAGAEEQAPSSAELTLGAPETAQATTTVPPATTTLPQPAATDPAPPAPTTTVPAPAVTSPPQPVPVIQGESLTNTLDMVFRLIPAGEFTMGSGGGRNEPPYSMPAHQVSLGRPFWLGTHEVTQEQWQKVMGGRPSKFRGQPNLPVERVSYVQIQEFLKRLNAREGTQAYRLPTEAEWEYACRAGSTTPWFFGQEPRLLSRFAWWIANSGLETHPVGQLSPNPWGLFDILGNVAELCADWFDRDYYQTSPGSDPPGPRQGSHRVARGGSWQSGPVRLHSAARVMAEDGPGLGLRLVRER